MPVILQSFLLIDSSRHGSLLTSLCRKSKSFDDDITDHGLHSFKAELAIFGWGRGESAVIIAMLGIRFLLCVLVAGFSESDFFIFFTSFPSKSSTTRTH